MSKSQAFRAASHFGLGARPGELEGIARDPRGWLRMQLKAPVNGQTALAGVPPSRETLGVAIEQLTRKRRLKRSRAENESAAEEELREMQRSFRRSMTEAVPAQIGARIHAGIETDSPFRERLVHFWSNHFTVSAAGKPFIASSCVAFESETIRKHLDGHFIDMLLAVEQHPVMLIYLDNHQSIGPDSRVGRRRNRGLNENLAREILELHTLGVDGGYSQRDVTALARIITGWTVANGRRVGGEPGTFAFMDLMHQRGDQILLGRRYRDEGVRQGERALRDLAAHPATARFLATKLVRHFVADDPPEDAIHRVARVYATTNGHLPSVHAALLDLDQAWEPRYRKLKTPNELVVSSLRGLGLSRLPGKPLLGSLKLLDQFPFTAPSPAGWPDTAKHWGSPNALLQRIDWGTRLGERVGSAREPRAMLVHMTGPDSRRALELSVERAASAAQGLALVLAGPHFQWR